MKSDFQTQINKFCEIEFDLIILKINSSKKVFAPDETKSLIRILSSYEIN